MNLLHQRLSRIFRANIRGKQPVFNRSLRDLGVDSLELILLAAGIHDEFHIHLAVDELSPQRSLEEIARKLASRTSVNAEGSSPRDSSPEQAGGDMVGPVPTLANRYSYFVQRVRNLAKWSVVSHVYRLRSPVSLAAFSRAVDLVVAWHDSLRLRVTVSPDRVDQVCLSPRDVRPLRVLDVPKTMCSDMASRWMTAEIQAAQEEFALPGDLFRVLLFRDELRGACWFCVIAHHLLVDALSFRMVMENLIDAYCRWSLDPGAASPARPPSLLFSQYSIESIAYWTQRAPEQVAIWLSLPWRSLAPLLPGTEPSDPLNTEGFTAQVLRTVDDSSFLESDRGTGCGFCLADLVVAAVAMAYKRWTGHSAMHLAFVMHGRMEEGLSGELARTVGWISETVPIVLSLQGTRRTFAVETQTQLVAAATSGRAFGVLKELVPADTPGPASIRGLPRAEVSLNINLVEPVANQHGPHLERDERIAVPSVCESSTQRVYLLSGGVIRRDGKLCIAWDFSEKLFSRSHVEAFTEFCCEEVSKFVHASGSWET